MRQFCANSIYYACLLSRKSNFLDHLSFTNCSSFFHFFPPEAIFPCLLYPPSPAMKSRVSDPDFDPGVCTSKGEISSNVYKMIILDTIKRHLFLFLYFWQYLKHSFYKRLKISLRLRYRPPEPGFGKIPDPKPWFWPSPTSFLTIIIITQKMRVSTTEWVWSKRLSFLLSQILWYALTSDSLSTYLLITKRLSLLKNPCSFSYLP